MPKGWPKGKPRKVVNGEPVTIRGDDLCVGVVVEAPIVPEDWTLGALLNVRPNEYGYQVTLYPEEFDYRKPHRAMTFNNSWECQEFVSNWYARTYVDPRA